jgi:predicted ribosomally synthesized peptide with nif11-like leader
MSVQSAQDFVNKVQTDASLKSQVEAASDVNAIVAIGGDAGFSFTAEEYQGVTASAWSAEAEELSEEDLEGVAGGNTNWTSSNAPGGDCYTYVCDSTTTTTTGKKTK